MKSYIDKPFFVFAFFLIMAEFCISLFRHHYIDMSYLYE